MTSAYRRSTDTTQPELPLFELPATSDPPREDGWRLDEHTRQIGLRGVARARAGLGRSEHADGARGRGGRGPTGRAA